MESIKFEEEFKKIGAIDKLEEFKLRQTNELIEIIEKLRLAFIK